MGVYCLLLVFIVMNLSRVWVACMGSGSSVVCIVMNLSWVWVACIGSSCLFGFVLL